MANADADRRWFAIVNPVAGRGACGRRAGSALETLKSAGLEVDPAVTRCRGHGTDLAYEAVRAGRRRILAFGGDGTVNEVVTGIAAASTDGSVTLGTVPLGTANSFLRDFGLQDFPSAVTAIVRGDAAPCDLLRCSVSVEGAPTLRWALNNVHIGFGANVGDLMNRRLKFLGHAGYTVGVIVEVMRLDAPRMTIELDGERIDGAFTMLNVANSQYTGGTMLISPGARVDDGLLDLLVIGRLGRIDLLRTFPRIFDGSHLTHRAVHAHRGRRVIIDSAHTLPLLIDGDVVGRTPLTVDVVGGAIRVVR